MKFPMQSGPRLDWLAALCLLVAPAAAADKRIDFNQDIRPILSDHCFQCHGPDAAKRKADLRLDTREGLFSKIDDVYPVVPGQPEQSDMILRVRSEDREEIMPPPKAHKPLKPAQIALLARWIAEGADFKGHWAFIAPVKPEVPVLANAGAVRNPIDAFIQATLSARGLAPSPEADRETLVRRVAFALTGLPPSLREVDEFIADESPDAFEKMVERYLASPHYGEQMARHWLDVARYGDTHGMHLDNERSMWPYRDWVVGAFNRNLPFDEFTIEQLAGDLLPDATQDQLVATGFNRCNVTTGEGGSIDAEWIFRYAVDRTATTAGTWLGLTAGCAVCHDHKFDPISQKEFYSLYAFFYSAADPALDGNTLLTAPTVQLISPEQRQQLDNFGARITAAEKSLEDQVQTVDYTDPATLDPRPPVQEFETFWVEDNAPEAGEFKASPGEPTQWVSVETGRVFSGQRALRRKAKGLAQDVYENAASTLEIPPQGKIFARVFIESDDLPKTIMLQFNKGGWLHRAVWGDYDAIQWGAPNTTERVNMGPLPEAGKWVRLEVEAAKIGLQAGDRITGLACTQFDGTVTWDQIGVTGRSDPAADPKRSLAAWLAANEGHPAKELPPHIQEILQKPAAERAAEPQKTLRDYFVATVCSNTKRALEPIQSEIAALKKQRDDLNASLPGSFIMKDLAPPRQANVMLRGQYDKPGDPVSRNVPAAFPPLENTQNPTRLDLARWLVADANPLTARVTVNRFWQQFFGTGLVKTSGDFGSQGEPPSHPELLDWLAVTFRESGWDVKALVRLLVTSATFRQSSSVTPELVQADPENRLLARGPRFRLDAEQLRDNALFVSGLIKLQIGGKGVKPYQPPNIWEPVGFVGSNTAAYNQDHGDALYRRSLYTFLKRTAPPPFMANFDAPNREQFCTRRDRSDTPLQALQLMNDVQHFEAARGLAERVMSTAARRPRNESTSRGGPCLRALRRMPKRRSSPTCSPPISPNTRPIPRRRRRSIHIGESSPKPDLPEPELAAWTLVANLLLNLDETLTRN